MLPKLKSSKDISGSTSRSSREVILAKISLVIVNFMFAWLLFRILLMILQMVLPEVDILWFRL